MGDGGRQRFEPERSWNDNTNLDKARDLLWPIKLKYGPGLSWGDLIVLAGNTAIESMGGKLLGFCGGRIDDDDGSESLLLGPSQEQEAAMPCEVDGNCTEPLGASTMGLIYVNPEGPMGKPEPKLSVAPIRDTFDRMNMDDRETVALIGGGHAFGKTHGPCPDGAGKKPVEDPINPWPGMCGTGKLGDAFTSGFEFPFTTNPTKWDNEYFLNLERYQWEKYMGPGGHYQWKVVGHSPSAPSPDLNGTQDIGMLTTDVALLEDPSYLNYVQLFASSMAEFDQAFASAWYKLTTRDMGPHSRCIGPIVPPPQPWQNPLPAPSNELADFAAVKHRLESMMWGSHDARGSLSRLAWRCSATFRATDFLGGCNGARIRLSPQKDWDVNANLDLALSILHPIKEEFGEGLSWADLIILAGNTVMEHASGTSIPFCPGRTDAEEDAGASDFLEPKVTGQFNDTLGAVKEAARLMGLTQAEFAALNAAGYAIGDRYCIHQTIQLRGLFCRRDRGENEPEQLDNRFFTTLLTNTWEEYTMPDDAGGKVYKAVGSDSIMFATDLWYRSDGELRAIAEEFAYDNAKFVQTVVAAWDKLTTADRFLGPAENLCDQPNSRHHLPFFKQRSNVP